MDTDHLIRTLAADNAYRARPVGFALMLALLAAAPVSLLMFFTELGVRPDVMVAMRNPFFDLKFAVTLALAISAIAVSLHLSRPEASLRGFGWLLLAPVGLLLGACFPLGIRLARRAHDRLIPWAWAVNGVFSVFAAAASLVVAINFGLKAMLLAGAACYLVNIFVIPTAALATSRPSTTS